MFNEKYPGVETLEEIRDLSQTRPPRATPGVVLSTPRQGVTVMESCEHKVVIVEDEGLIAADLKGRLERAGYDVPAVAASGAEALRVIRKTTPDLVLMDIRIKGTVDGIQVAEQVRQEFDIPVIYLTAYEDRETLERASQTQAFGYIKKPIASSSLQGSIEMAISKHRYERHLREQRDWLSASFAAVPHAVMATDGKGRICYLNRVAEELTGWKVDEALGRASKDILQFYYERTGQPVEDFVPVAMLQGQTVPLPGEICLRDRRDVSRAVEGSIALRWSEGRVEGTLITFRDVTLGRFEQELSSQDNKQQGLARLADGIAGQLDSDLSVVARESTHLLEAVSVDGALHERAKAIEGAALDAMAVASRLRTFTRQPEICSRMIQVNEVLARLEEPWKRMIPNVTIVFDPDPRPVQADAGQLTRALVMVLQHARSQMEEDAHVLIETSRPEIDGMRDWNRIRISYHSAGEDAAALERVFEPSWAAESQDLSVAYALVRKMGGLLVVRAGQDKAVRFEIYLPSVEVAVAGAPVPATPPPVVLLVDANSEVRRVLHGHFEQHGYQLLEASTCEEAVLLADLYQGPIPFVIANPAKDDEGRAELARTLAAIRPGIRVRLLDGYWETAPETGPPGMKACHLTKWNLLEWAHHVLESAACAAAAS